MTGSADKQKSVRDHHEPAASEIEAVASELVALVEEFEAALNEGHVPPAFTERLAQIREAAEKLIDP